jgi:hypothetical protein
LLKEKRGLFCLSDTSDEAIIQVIEKHKPETIQQLVKLLEDRSQLTESEIIERVTQLHRESRIKLEENFLISPAPKSLKVYLKTKSAYWYFIAVILTLASTAAVFGIREGEPESIFRYFFGFIYVLVLPGYCLVRILFLGGQFALRGNTRMDWLMKFSFSTVLSIAIVSMVGLALNYIWVITLNTLVLSLSSLTILLATIGVIREYRKYNELVRGLRNGR